MDLVSLACNPAPEGAVTGKITTQDRVNLRFARWHPPVACKGTVCLFPGRGEFIEKYFETVRDLRARGFAVATLDWRGQGLSDRALGDPRKGHVGDFSEYETDVTAFMNDVVLPHCPSPLFAIGHSMGGAVMLRVARRDERWFDRIVLSTPMVRFAGREASRFSRLTALAMQLTGLGSSYVPGGDPVIPATLPFDGNPVTSDPARYARTRAVVEAAPELGIGSPTVSWLNAAYRAMREFDDPAYPGKVRQPLMLVAASHDRLVPPAAIEDLAGRLARSHCVVVGGQHEPMMELDCHRNEFWAAFDAFVPGTQLVAR
jgi:lysophospholipase